MAKAEKRTKTGKIAKKAAPKKGARKGKVPRPQAADASAVPLHARTAPPLALGAAPAVLDRLWGVVQSRRNADPAVSHSARLLARGTAPAALTEPGRHPPGNDAGNRRDDDDEEQRQCHRDRRIAELKGSNDTVTK